MPTIWIGSRAAEYHSVDLGRKPKDSDAFSNFRHWLFDPVPDCYWDYRLWEWFKPGTMTRYATLDELYTIKVSHSYWELKNGSWLKHITDAMKLKQAGATLIPELHKILYSIWEDEHGKKVVDLTLDKADFFDDAVRRKYDHDSLHMSVAYGDRPIYEECLKDGATVQMDMKKVWALPFDRQVQLFREEVYVTALERKLIPSDFTTSPRAAYAWALRRTITSLTKGRSAQFLVENYDTFKDPDINYVEQHRRKAHHLIEWKGAAA